MQQQQKYSPRKDFLRGNGRQISRFLSALVWMKLMLLTSVPLALAQTGTYNAGSQSEARGDRATAVGHKARAGASGIAIGFETWTGSSSGIAIGSQTRASSSSVVVGGAAISYAQDSVVIGIGAGAGDSQGDHQYITTIGSDANAIGLRSTTVGQNSRAAANEATAVGQSARALHVNSAAFGQGATTTRANQQVFGDGTNTYTLPGLASQASTAAQTPVGVSVVLTDSAGNLATDDGTFLTQAIQQEIESSVTDIENNTAGISSNTGRIQTNTVSINSHASSIRANAAAIQALSGSGGEGGLLNSFTGPTIIEHHAGLIRQNVETLETNMQAIEGNAQAIETNAQAIETNAQAIETSAQSIRSNAADIRRNAEGVALALAVSSPSLRTDQKFSFSAGYGNFDSSSALAISTSFRLSEKVLLSLGGGFGLDSSVGGGKAVFTFVK